MIEGKYQMTGNPGPTADKYNPTNADLGMALNRIESMLIALCEFVEETPAGPIFWANRAQTKHEDRANG